MYCPKHFHMPESDYAHFIRSFPLATMFDKESGQVAQCPLIYDANTQRLMGHLAIGNPFLTQTASERKVTILFHGHQGYISPNWYDELQHAKNPESFQHREVPTWNYSSLEVIGTLELLEKDHTLAVLAQQTEQFEQQVGEDWTLDKLTETQQQAMINAITAFTVTMTQWQGKDKLSQNKSAAVQSSLLQHMANLQPLEHQLLRNTMKAKLGMDK